MPLPQCTRRLSISHESLRVDTCRRCRAIHSTPRGRTLLLSTLSLGQCTVLPLSTCSCCTRASPVSLMHSAIHRWLAQNTNTHASCSSSTEEFLRPLYQRAVQSALYMDHTGRRVVSDTCIPRAFIRCIRARQLIPLCRGAVMCVSARVFRSSLYCIVCSGSSLR